MVCPKCKLVGVLRQVKGSDGAIRLYAVCRNRRCGMHGRGFATVATVKDAPENGKPSGTNEEPREEMSEV